MCEKWGSTKTLSSSRGSTETPSSSRGSSALSCSIGVKTNVILLENSPLSAAHEWQYYRLNYEIDVQIYSQCAGDNHESAPVVIGNCSLDYDSRCRSSLSWPQTVWLQAFPWPPSYQHKAIPGTQVEPTFIRKYNKYPPRPPMSSGLTSLASPTAMAWSQWNTRYRVPGSELSLK
ncbi:uncharacterized protein TNCV_3885861 [Trichonephila clavipes]|nr:uncharacterized protein TNCV_3885861 [Trichonephila clavipes]